MIVKIGIVSILAFLWVGRSIITIAATQSTRAGGYVKMPLANQDRTPYNPEQIYSAEVGRHLSFLDSRLCANLAYYFMCIQDRQAYVGEQNFKTLKNLGNAISTGLDVDLSYQGERFIGYINGNIGISKYLNGRANKGTVTTFDPNNGSQTRTYDVSGLE